MTQGPRFAFVCVALYACSPAPSPQARPVPVAGGGPALPPVPAPVQSVAPVPSVPAAVAKAEPSQLDPDGNDEEAVTGVVVPELGHFEKVGRHWAALQRVCDFAVLGNALYLAHATQPLGLGGASVTRYAPQDKQPFSLAFNWNREGEPERGGGAGQGFLRLRQLDGRLYVPDADPPYLGLGMATGIEGYVFVSDKTGAFSAARMPGHLPPRAATSARSGTVVLPGGLHDFDVIRYRGKLYASTSAAIPPNGNAKTSPGTLLTPNAKESAPWQVAFTYAGAPGEESVRLGYMVRYRDRLYVAISPLYGLDRHDFLVISPPRERATFDSADARAVTVLGGTHTLRWYADAGRLYWITIDSNGVELRATDDGEHFRLLALPPGAGHPSDILRVGSQLVVLAEHGLYELLDDRFVLRAPISDAKTPFKVDDGYCAPPLVAFQGSLYVGDQVRGNLWKLVAD